MKRALVLASLALAGCGAGDSGPSDEEVIRGWNAAVNSGDFAEAADLFARDAVVEQVGEVRLSTRERAIAFNRSLPCRADVTGIQADGDATLASFSLREGRTGECTEGGRARVRFVIRDGLIREWRQLPEGDAPGPLPPDAQSA